MDKIIVTVAPTSNFHGKEANPALPFSPQEVADAVYECWNEGASWELDSVQNPPEDNYLRLDCTKAITMLGWAPKIQLIAALEWVCEWYRGYQQNEDLRLLTERQIERYENLGTE